MPGSGRGARGIRTGIGRRGWSVTLLVLVLAALALSPAPPKAEGAERPNALEGVTFEGRFVQGGLVIGHTDPRARVEIAGRDVAVGPDGRFLLGFGFDAPARERLVVTIEGKKAEISLEVAQRSYEVQAIEGLPQALVTPPPGEMARIRSEQAAIEEARMRGTGTSLFRSAFVWPVKGTISGLYGSRRVLNGEPRAPHLGLDIAAAEGTPVVAPTEGTVVLAAKDFFFTGNTVMIDHGQGLSTIYAHLSRLAVEAGDHVAQGQVIGAVGRSGRATGPHLHWGVHLDGVGLDPELVAGPPGPEAPEGDARAP
jgi:biotin carboxyl carrier protein